MTKVSVTWAEELDEQLAVTRDPGKISWAQRQDQYGYAEDGLNK